MNNLNIDLFELLSSAKCLPRNYINKKFYEEDLDPLLYENQWCLISNVYNFCNKDQNL